MDMWCKSEMIDPWLSSERWHNYVHKLALLSWTCVVTVNWYSEQTLYLSQVCDKIIWNIDPLNAKVVGNMVSESFHLHTPETAPKQFWKPMSCLTVETYFSNESAYIVFIHPSFYVLSFLPACKPKFATVARITQKVKQNAVSILLIYCTVVCNYCQSTQGSVCTLRN